MLRKGSVFHTLYYSEEDKTLQDLQLFIIFFIHFKTLKKRIVEARNWQQHHLI